MLKISFLFTALFFSATLLWGQEATSEDYNIYNTLLNTENLDSIKSITIIESGIEKEKVIERGNWVAESLKSNDLNYKTQVYNKTGNGNKTWHVIIDSATEKYIIDYCENPGEGLLLSDSFSVKYKVSLANKSPIKIKSIEKDWERFYKKNPGSGGIFSFSKISYYSPDKSIAIFYYWRKRSGLNGHGSIAVLEKTNGTWFLKYKTELWVN